MEIFKLIGSIFIKTEEAEKSIDGTTKKVQEMASKVGDTLTTVGTKMSSLGTKLLPVSTAIGGLGVVAVKASAEVKAMNSQFEQTFGELQDQASDAMGRVATESGILQTRLQGVGTSIYAFAKSSGADSAEAMELMETALRATADASAYYDRSLEETSESLMSFLKGNFANDAQLGVSCTETTRNAKAMELFGQKYNDLSEIQKQQTLLKMVTDAQALSGAMGQASRESDGFENVMGNLKESVKMLGAEFGEVLLPTVIEFIQGLTGLIQGFSQMDEGSKKTIVNLAGIAVAVAPALIVFGKLTSGIGTVVSAGGKLIGSLSNIGKQGSSVATNLSKASGGITQVASSAGSSAGSVASAGASFGQLAGQALKLVAVGASFALVGVGIKLIADSCIALASAGTPAIAVMGGLLVAISAMALGASAIAPALTAGAVGLVAFGGAVTLVGAGVALASAGLALLATQLPNISTHGTSASTAILALSGAIIAFSASAVTSAVGITALGASTAVFSGALVVLTATFATSAVGGLALNVSLELISKNMESIAKDASEAESSLSSMLSGIDSLNAGVKSVKAGFDNFIDSISDKFTGTFTPTIEKSMQKASTTMKSSMSQMKSSADSGMQGILTSCKQKMSSVLSEIRQSLNKAQQMFQSVRFSFNQHIALPHFSMYGSFDAQTGAVPSVSVSWYKKAMENGMIMNSPTIFGYNAKTNQFMAGGEAGSETVVGTESLMNMIQRAVTAENAGLVDKLDTLVSMLSKYFPEIIVGMNRNIVLDSGALVAELAPKMDTKLGIITTHKGRGN